jgi:molybdopterin synthase catalytic subunit
MIEIVREKIDIAHVIQSVEDPAAGSVAVFIGTTRNHSDGKLVLGLEYDAYAPMALKLMNRIAGEVKSKWGVQKISIVHRVGRLEVGGASVVIAVSSAHRKEAFEACRYAIDTLKKEVPIWKKEFFEDGEMWVDSKSMGAIT